MEHDDGGKERAAVIAAAAHVPTVRVRNRLLSEGSEGDRSAALEALVTARDPVATDPLVRRLRAGERSAAFQLAQVGAAQCTRRPRTASSNRSSP